MKKRIDPVIDCSDSPSLTIQHFKEEVDVNNIIEKFMQTGQAPMANKQAEFGHASSLSFTEAQYLVAEAKEEFMHLPSAARAHFLNDPARYLDAASDPEQRETFINLGLLEGREQTAHTENARRSSDTPPQATPAPEAVPGNEVQN